MMRTAFAAARETKFGMRNGDAAEEPNDEPRSGIEPAGNGVAGASTGFGAGATAGATDTPSFPTVTS